MSQNTLYNFIKSEEKSLAQYFTGQNITLTKKTNFFLMELPFSRQQFNTEEERYQLQEHHISVYNNEQNKNPVLSQYHYTAYFSDNNNNTYQLHVYLNHKDEKTINPVFSIMNKETGNYEPITSKELNETFLSLAYSQTRSIIAELRNKMRNKIQQYDKNYSDANLRASELYVDLPKTLKEYRRSLNKIITNLKSLIPLVNNSSYGSTLAFTIRLEKMIEQLIVDENNKANTPKKMAPSKPANLPVTSVANNNQSLFRQTKKSTTSGQIVVVDKLFAEFSNFNNLHSRDKPCFIENIIKEINTLFLEIESEKNPNGNCLIRLNDLHGKTRIAGEKLFNTFISDKDFDLAAQLPSFHHLLSTPLLVKALLKRDADLLEFIVKYGDCSLYNTPLTIKGKTYQSAVHYCYNENSSNKPMVNCLAVLIKNGATIHIRDENKMPILYVILSTQDHPLKLALPLEMPTKSAPFYKKLTADLQNYIDNNELTEERRLELRKAIAMYKNRIMGINLNGKLSIENIIKENQHSELFNKVNKLNPTTIKFFAKLYIDPDLSILFRDYNEAAKKYEQHLSCDGRKKRNKLMTKFLAAVDGFKEEYLDYEFFKNAAIEFYTDLTIFLNTQNQLNELPELLKMSSKKERKELVTQNNELSLTVNQNQKQYKDILSTKNQNSNKPVDPRAIEAARALEKMDAVGMLKKMSKDLWQAQKAIVTLQNSLLTQPEQIKEAELITTFSSIYSKPNELQQAENIDLCNDQEEVEYSA